ncbi:hypothetical protein EX30DRAFT_350594 [Ascodesmis nigricans]|uniref:Uncharacterized protein n=1 Tax=Ascodesmis nigricans TaxID=341454 RepID=A0A4V3SI81_9PEZI|nr:hypothetical protein EX30DRAFT_350594 [Ascodesmis nigricans]
MHRDDRHHPSTTEVTLRVDVHSDYAPSVDAERALLLAAIKRHYERAYEAQEKNSKHIGFEFYGDDEEDYGNVEEDYGDDEDDHVAGSECGHDSDIEEPFEGELAEVEALGEFNQLSKGINDDSDSMFSMASQSDSSSSSSLTSFSDAIPHSSSVTFRN